MKIELTNGAILELSKEDEMRVIKHFSSMVHQVNHHKEHAEDFLERAQKHICKHVGFVPTTEEELKHVMTENLYLGDEDTTDLCYECIEAIIGMFAVQHYNDVE